MIGMIFDVLALIAILLMRIVLAAGVGTAFGILFIEFPMTWILGEGSGRGVSFLSALLGTAAIGYYFGMEDWRPKGKTKRNK